VLHVSEPGSDADRSAEFRDLRERLAADLRKKIAGMSLDNSWSGRSGALSKSTNLAAKQFDLIVFRAELALLQVDAAFASLGAARSTGAALLRLVTDPGDKSRAAPELNGRTFEKSLAC
jgi:type I restriction enzyme, R subunit